jgi:hypothetical protein
MVKVYSKKLSQKKETENYKEKSLLGLTHGNKINKPVEK